MAVTYSRPCILETEQETTHLCSTWGYPELRCKRISLLVSVSVQILRRQCYLHRTYKDLAKQSALIIKFFSPGIVLANQTLQLACVKSKWGFSKVTWFVFKNKLRDSASSFHWLSSSIFSCSFVVVCLSRIGDISSHLHYMMFQNIQTIYFL